MYIAILDLGVGNLRSVEQAVKTVAANCTVEVTADVARIATVVLRSDDEYRRFRLACRDVSVFVLRSRRSDTFLTDVGRFRIGVPGKTGNSAGAGCEESED